MRLQHATYLFLCTAILCINGSSSHINESLTKAVLLNDIALVETLLNNGANPNEVYLGQPLVIHAARLCKFKIATLFIKRGADFSGPMVKDPIGRNDLQNIVAFTMTNCGNQEEAFELLEEVFKRGYNLTASIYTESVWYLAHSEKIIDLLMKYGANPNQIILDHEQIWTPILRAIDLSNINLLKVLLDKGADINQKGKPWWHGEQTPLSYAMLKGYYKMVELLVSHGAKL